MIVKEKKSEGKFIKKTTYYTGVVYEWNLPSGHTCPFAVECKVLVDRTTGKFENKSSRYRCYAASSERFPAVRQHRWGNYDFLKNGGVPILPHKAENIRIHASGDFYSQEYFDMWLDVAMENKNVNFWAFTKSINYWIKRVNDIPQNLILTASYGGVYDCLIDEHNLKHTIVYGSYSDVPDGMPIDTNDDYARVGGVNFALLDNNKKHNAFEKSKERGLFSFTDKPTKAD